MKEAMGGVPLFEIVVVFILLFTGIMCLTINHSKAFAVKDEIINIIETNTTQYSAEGILSDNVTKEIAEQLKAQYKIDLDKKKVDLKETIKNTGIFTVDLRLFEGVVGKLKLEIVGR